MTVGRSRAIVRSTPSVPSATARCNGCPSGSLRSNATSSARCCGSGSSPIACSETSASRSPTAAYASSASDSIGRQTSTRYERSAACASPAFQSTVFPIPISPSSTSAIGPTSIPSKNSPRSLSSFARPMIACGSANTREVSFSGQIVYRRRAARRCGPGSARELMLPPRAASRPTIPLEEGRARVKIHARASVRIYSCLPLRPAFCTSTARVHTATRSCIHAGTPPER